MQGCFTLLVAGLLVLLAAPASFAHAANRPGRVANTIVRKHKIPLYKAKGNDPLVYSGRFPFRRVT